MRHFVSSKPCCKHYYVSCQHEFELCAWLWRNALLTASCSKEHPVINSQRCVIYRCLYDGNFAWLVSILIFYLYEGLRTDPGYHAYQRLLAARTSFLPFRNCWDSPARWMLHIHIADMSDSPVITSNIPQASSVTWNGIVLLRKLVCACVWMCVCEITIQTYVFPK
jgi:hypothetical protein